MNSERILILVDEKGDPGSTDKSTKEFTMTASLCSDPESLRQITESAEKGTRYPNDDRLKSELKYWSSSDTVRFDVLLKIRRTNPKVYAVHIRKSEIKPGTTSRYTYAAVTRDLMEEVMKDDELKNKRIITVIFDETDHLQERKARDIVIEAAANNNVYGIRREDIIKESSKKNVLLQAHDFLAGAVGSKYIDGKSEDFEIISDVTVVRSSHPKKK